jgi:hypothetical protein
MKYRDVSRITFKPLSAKLNTGDQPLVDVLIRARRGGTHMIALSEFRKELAVARLRELAEELEIVGCVATPCEGGVMVRVERVEMEPSGDFEWVCTRCHRRQAPGSPVTASLGERLCVCCVDEIERGG